MSRPELLPPVHYTTAEKEYKYLKNYANKYFANKWGVYPNCISSELS